MDNRQTARMANNTRGGCVRKAWKPSSSRPILIYFEFRSKPSLISVICMDPHSPNKLLATKYCFLILVDDTSFFFFLSFFLFLFCFFCFCYCTLLLIFTKIILLLSFFFMNFFFIFSCSGIFRNVPRSGFIDAHEPGWPGLSGWLVLPRWLLARYYMKRASPEPPFLYRDWKQCAWAVCYSL